MASPTDETYQSEPGVVKDELYSEIVEHGDEEFKPPEGEDQPAPGHKYNLRHAKPGGSYDEALDQEPFENVDDQLSKGGTTDIDRRVASYVARSHDPRPPEDHWKSALKASEIYETVTGHPLEINEKGEVVTE
ncbi:hypothetical protein SpCBS45565_g06638 [Spizellomyces sp. 'palustris']|nr:hypothetical protein SpCBS45565_g06638 [Spizellomyces sp. 'palustris']